jgi:phosphatidylglycerophosphatase C
MIIAQDKTSQGTQGQRLKKQLVLFDFDGTITTKDTLAEFMIFYHGKLKYTFGLLVLAPVIGAYLFRLMPNWKSKQYFLTWFLKNESADTVKTRCREFSENYLPSLIRPGAIEAIRQYKAQGATVAVVSASADLWVKPWCDHHGILCLATRLEIKNEKLTGRILGKNCHGEEKVCRVKEAFDLSAYNEIIAYGDTAGDREMLAMANHGYYKPFRN